MPRESKPASTLASAVVVCREDAGAMDALQEIYARAEADCAALGLTCRACGLCCRFVETGHFLLVSPLELALLTEIPAESAAVSAGVCPYQRENLCTARTRRTLGCRVFFCEGRVESRGDLYERYHRQIRRLHEKHGLPYLYAEITLALSGLIADSAQGQNADFPIDRGMRQT